MVVDPSELTDPSDEVRYGAGFAHLADLARLAEELAARGRVLPVLLTESGRPAARWRPVVQGLDAVARADLVRRLPPVARAEQRRPGDVAGQDPDALVDAALARFTDAAVRERLGAAPRCRSRCPPARTPGGVAARADRAVGRPARDRGRAAGAARGAVGVGGRRSRAARRRHRPVPARRGVHAARPGGPRPGPRRPDR
ncbi:hypothetical protein [Pseudonocardia sp. ICBG601]|uniref:hypothetical protein n=1 Tax=Pseudonocardia sp. ICBG601 TaxID=2846759 RepID=UPI001CF630F7|nr:hypothetical protein [Pseudonocardia sp. ICBG601]